MRASKPPRADDQAGLKGTMMLQGPLQMPPQGVAPPQSRSGRAPSHAPAPLLLRSVGRAASPSAAPRQCADRAALAARIGRTTRTIAACLPIAPPRARSPLCAVNGILALLPMPAIQGSIREAEELQRAVKSDLRPSTAPWICSAR